ncbi:MAG: hypothetical protein PVF66_10345 [Candidatus Aminicenantes bacterium]|jgi:hypothetical protein
MGKKIVSLVTIIAFISFSLSCTVHKTTKEKLTPESRLEGDRVEILAVMKTSGEYIEFPKDWPGEILQGRIMGPGKKELEIKRDDIQEIKVNSEGRTYEIITNDGKKYPPPASIIDRTDFQELEDRVIISFYESISIPLSEVELAWIRRVDPGMSFVTSVGAVALSVAAVLGAVFLIIALTKESCPFIYSFNGVRYIFDAEPYGGAVCRGLKRTEWCGLEHLKEVNGQYKIMITNEVNETQHTDEIKLLVIDHPEGVQVAPGINGDIHTISLPEIPALAYDGKGRDLTPYISKKDWIYWQTQTDEKNAEIKEDLKDELIFEFPKPNAAKQTKLLVNACNTLWGSQMLKQYLELYGPKIREYYNEVNSLGDAFFNIMNLTLREELYSLHIRVETEDGWKSKGMIFGGGPFISEDKVYPLDISDVPGETLKIKLTPPATFWMINYLAVDYAEDLPIQIKEIDAAEAIDHEGQDLREILAKKDNHFLIMPNIGDSAELTFNSPPRLYGLDRSFILKASGYYDIHLDSKRESLPAIIERFLREPGFAIQYSLQKYNEWKKKIMEKNDSR